MNLTAANAYTRVFVLQVSHVMLIYRTKTYSKHSHMWWWWWRSKTNDDRGAITQITVIGYLGAYVERAYSIICLICLCIVWIKAIWMRPIVFTATQRHCDANFGGPTTINTTYTYIVRQVHTSACLPVRHRTTNLSKCECLPKSSLRAKRKRKHSVREPTRKQLLVSGRDSKIKKINLRIVSCVANK